MVFSCPETSIKLSVRFIDQCLAESLFILTQSAKIAFVNTWTANGGSDRVLFSVFPVYDYRASSAFEALIKAVLQNTSVTARFALYYSLCDWSLALHKPYS